MVKQKQFQKEEIKMTIKLGTLIQTKEYLQELSGLK